MPESRRAAKAAGTEQQSDAPQAEPAAAEEPTEQPASDSPARYEYVGDQERTYASVPVTVLPGDVVELAADPGDGRWRPTDRPVTRRPDNAPPAKPAEPESEQR